MREGVVARLNARGSKSVLEEGDVSRLVLTDWGQEREGTSEK